VAIATAGAALRLRGSDWDAGRYLHPDERFLAQVHAAVDLPGSLREYLDTGASPLNPNNREYGFYVYGDLPLTIVQLLGAWTAAPGNHLDAQLFGSELSTEFATSYRLGRAVSALCDTLTLLLLFAVGAQLYGRAVGLLASALYAGAVLPIQQAHYFTVDSMATVFVVAALWLAARAATRARWSDDLLFGLALGAGLACKLSVFPIAALLGIGVVLRLAAQGQAVRDGALPAPQQRRALAQLFVRAAISLNVVALSGILSFRLLQPYAFEPPFTGPVPSSQSVMLLQATLNVLAPHLNPAWLEQMEKSRQQQVGNDDSPPNHQWATRTPIVFAWRNLVQYGLGWPLGIAAWLGWLWALVEGLRGRAESWRHVLPVAWIGLYFGWYGAGWVLTMRYFLPLAPVLCLTAAWALLRVAAPQWDASLPDSRPVMRERRVVGVAAIALVLIPTWAWAIAFTNIYTQPHTRIAASRWLYAKLAPKLALRIDGDDGKPIDQPVGLAPNAPAREPDKDMPEPEVTVVQPGTATTTRFRAAQTGALQSARLADVRGHDDGTMPSLQLAVRRLDAADETSARCAPDGARGAVCRFSIPLRLEAGREYELRVATDRPARLAGTPLANEGHWDDALPINLPEMDHATAGFASYPLEMAWEDDAIKRRRLRYVLDRVDYVVMSSNRFSGSLPRNPLRWPMTIDYYRALFSGALGFELAAEFTSPPRLGGWSFDDRDAEEAFTVYDHPRVLIYRKTAAYDSARTAAILAQAELTAVVRRRAVDVQEEPAALAPATPPPAYTPARYQP
jgi:hypothetical protein